MDNQQKTIIVTGLARGGTSVVAAVLDALGVYMGPSTNLRIGGAFENEMFNFRNPAAWQAETDHLNSLYDVWGFKSPDAHTYFSMLPDSVRNPYFIFVVRDTVAVAKSRLYRDGIEVKLSEIEKERYAMNDVLANLRHSKTKISYRGVLNDPHINIQRLVNFCGLRSSSVELGTALGRVKKKKGYLNYPEDWRSNTDKELSCQS